MKKLFLSLFLFSIVFFTVEAQNINKIQNLADEYLRIEEYHHALPLYLKLDSLKPNDGKINYSIGKCYMHTDYKTKAIPYFEKTLTVGGAPLDVYYDLGQCYHLIHSFDKAIKFYRKAQNRVPESVENPAAYQEDLTRRIASCEFAKTLIENPIDMEIENIGDAINTKFPEFVPLISADETTLIFTARRDNTTGGLKDYDGMYYEDVYISKKIDGDWDDSENIGPVINTETHDACVGLSPDGQKLFLHYPNNKLYNGKFSGDLYVSDWDGEAWTKPERMPDGINSKGWEPSASISADENTLFFSSNREGGKGGLDIYWVKKLPDGSWATPQPIDEINTKFDDDAPFIHSDNRTLYFSSRGHLGMGGYDIFRTIYDEKTEKWSEPINMGYPINTAGDDIYFVWSADGKRGYFSSYRANDSYGEKDIYVVHVPQEGSSFAVLKGTILDKETNEPLIANVKLSDVNTKKMVGFYTSNSEGRFTAIIPQKSDFALLTGTKNYKASYDSLSIPEVTGYYEERITIYLEKGEDDVVVSIDTVKEEPKVGEKFVLNNIYFDFDKATLREASKTELNKIYDVMDKYGNIKIEVGAHTDAWGSESYNMKLSGRRAKSVVDYLVSKGIDRKRLLDKAYGESKPVAPSNNPENNQKNRRIEFKVIDNKQD